MKKHQTSWTLSGPRIPQSYQLSIKNSCTVWTWSHEHRHEQVHFLSGAERSLSVAAIFRSLFPISVVIVDRLRCRRRRNRNHRLLFRCPSGRVSVPWLRPLQCVCLFFPLNARKFRISWRWLWAANSVGCNLRTTNLGTKELDGLAKSQSQTQTWRHNDKLLL